MLYHEHVGHTPHGAQARENFVLENVAGILSKKHEKSLNEIIDTFKNLGYDPL